MFLFPLLTLSMWAVGAISNIKDDSYHSDNKVFKQEKTEKQFSHFFTTEVTENDFVVTELEPEFEVELEWCNSDCTPFFTKAFHIEKKSKLFCYTHFYTKETIPLYDLFCNWKFHLS